MILMHLRRTLLLGATVVSGCRTEQLLDVAPVASVAVSAPYAAISPGEVHQLRVTLRDPEGDDLGPRATSWRSLDPGFATVDDSGRVTGVAVGVARLVASSGGEADTIMLPVKSSWKRVWAGSRLFCAERISGGTWCWGDTPGDGSVGTSYAPVPLAGGLTLRPVSRGSAACGLTSDGSLYCWDSSSRLPDAYGNGPDSTHGPTPTLAASGIKFKPAYAVGQCGAGLDGTGWCWGTVKYGVDTTQMFNFRSAPDTVLGGISWQTLQMGDLAACGLDLTGTAYCFGDGSYDLLGQGNDQSDRKLPVPVLGGHTFDSLVVQGASACGLTPQGEAWCWGTGILGSGGGYGSTGTPQLVSGGHHFRALRTGIGTSFYCGIDDADGIWCWGSTPQRFTSPFPFVDIAGNYYTTCGVTAGGGLYCQGRELLGDGSRTPSDKFVRVTDP